ncbi:MAG: response regulator [Chitinispirillaceae bacterium]|nr:response regulator [Chitinispirillaceae bacterium]
MIQKILIVDDSPVARKMLKASIPKDKEYEIYEACNGKEGIEKFKEVSPDITFMDLTMPVLDGYKAIPELRKINPHAIVIVCSADVQPKSIAEVFSLGALTVLKKPAKTESVQNVMDQANGKLKNLREQNESKQ